MLQAGARFVLPLAVTALGVIGQSCSPRTSPQKSAPELDAAIAFVQGTVQPKNFRQAAQNKVFIAGAMFERNGPPEKFYPSEEYYAYGNGQQALSIDALNSVFTELAETKTESNCKTVVTNFHAKKTLSIFGDTAVRREEYHNDTTFVNIELNQEINPRSFYAALGYAFCDTQEKLQVIDYTDYGMRSLADVAAADLPVGTQIMFHANAENALHHGKFTHPIRAMMERMNPEETGYMLRPTYMLQASVLETDLQNDPHLVVVSDEELNPVKPGYGGTHELYIVNIKELTQHMMDTDFDGWAMPEDGVPGVPYPKRIIKAVKKAARHGQNFETLNISKVQEGVDTQTQADLLTIMTSFALATTDKEKGPNYERFGVKGSDYFKGHLLKLAVK